MTQLYRHFDKDDVLLYVGISLSALVRLNQHRITSDWFDQITTIRVETFSSRQEALKAERLAIQTERPFYNEENHCGCLSEAEILKLPCYETIQTIEGRTWFIKRMLTRCLKHKDIEIERSGMCEIANHLAELANYKFPLPNKEGETK